MILQKKTAAPHFELYATPDQKLKLTDFRGKRIILAFYPADWSPVCSDQMTLYNETLKLFHKYNAEILGISVDSKWCHMAFAQNRKFHFPLLADFEPKGEVSMRYGVYNEVEGESRRALFVIDEEGIIQWSYLSPDGINPGADGILDALESMANKNNNLFIMSKLRTAVNEQDHKTGNLNAKVVLVEYGDYQCSHCGIAHPFVKKLLKQFQEELLFIFRNFPLQEVHPDAMIAAQAAEAADKQGKFWKMHNMIYEHQDDLSSESLVAFARALELDIDSFGKDANSQDVLARIENDFESGIRSGVNGTPSFFINGVFINSYDESYESLADAVRNLVE